MNGNHDVDDTGIIIVKWDNGATSFIESGWWHPHAYGPEAYTQLYGKTGFGQLFPTYIALPARETRTIQRIESGFPSVRSPHCSQSMYDAQLAYFVECIRKNQIPLPGGLKGWTHMRIVDAAYESSRTGKVVAL